MLRKQLSAIFLMQKTLTLKALKVKFHSNRLKNSDVDKNFWEEEANGIEEFFKKFGDKLPKELKESLETLKANLK